MIWLSKDALKQVELNFDIDALLYNTTGASYQCSLHHGLCVVKLSFLRANAAVLATSSLQQVIDTWTITSFALLLTVLSVNLGIIIWYNWIFEFDGKTRWNHSYQLAKCGMMWNGRDRIRFTTKFRILGKGSFWLFWLWTLGLNSEVRERCFGEILKMEVVLVIVEVVWYKPSLGTPSIMDYISAEKMASMISMTNLIFFSSGEKEMLSFDFTINSALVSSFMELAPWCFGFIITRSSQWTKSEEPLYLMKDLKSAGETSLFDSGCAKISAEIQVA